MNKYTIQGTNGMSLIIIGKWTEQLNTLLNNTAKVFIITDNNVASFYREKFSQWPVFEVTPGESSKELPALSDIYVWLLEKGADRSSFILAIGGGVVCDLAGFVAATFMRGVKFGFVATTLLAQVDASVGGKNGVNLSGYKNIIGTFTQPEFVICDADFLYTLPDDEMRNGLSEIIKHALISDTRLFEFLEANKNAIMSREKQAIDYVVGRSVEIKSSIVQADEREHGIRKLLNFGHTYGHAIEKIKQIPHGQAVSIGMVFEANLSVGLGLLNKEQSIKVLNLIRQYDLPVSTEIDPKLAFNVMMKDKKKKDNSIHLVLLNRIGEAIVREFTEDELNRMINKIQ